MADKDVLAAIRNLRKHPHFDVRQTEGGHYSVWYKDERVGTLSGSPGDRNNLLIHLKDISRKTGLEINRKGRVVGTRLKVVHARGGGQEPVMVIPAEMASDLDGDDELFKPKRKVDLTLPPGPVVSSGKRQTPPGPDGPGRPTLEYEPAPAAPEQPEYCYECETVGINCRAHQHAPEVASPTEEPTVEAAAESTTRKPRRTETKKRPSLKPEALKARRDFVVEYLAEHPGHTFRSDDLHALLQSVDVDMTSSGVRMMMQKLAEDGRIKMTREGSRLLFYTPEADESALTPAPADLSSRPSAPPEPEPEPEPVEEPVLEPEPAAPAPPPAPEQPLGIGHVLAERPQMERPEQAPAYQNYLRGQEVKNMSNGTTATPDLADRINQLEKENLALRMLAKMKGLSDDDINMAINMARSMQ